MKKDSLYIVMPAYNEAENIDQVLADWYPIIENLNSDSRLVIADSGSTDSTHKKLSEFQKTHSKLEIISDSGKLHGQKVVALYKYAITQGAEFVFQTDSDGQTVASEFENFWAQRNDYDAILGNRKNRGDGKFRTFVEWSCCKCIQFYLHVKVKDSNVPYRLMRCSVVNTFIDKIPADHNLPNILITVYLALGEHSIKYIDISFLAREGGKSMYDLKKIFIFGINMIKDFQKIKKQSRR